MAVGDINIATGNLQNGEGIFVLVKGKLPMNVFMHLHMNI